MYGNDALVVFLLAISFAGLSGVLYTKHRSPLSKVPTSKEEIEKMEFNKYYELSEEQLTDLSTLMNLSKRLEAVEEYLGINSNSLSPCVKAMHSLSIGEEYKTKVLRILELEEKGYSEEQICEATGLRRGEVELLKQLLES